MAECNEPPATPLEDPPIDPVHPSDPALIELAPLADQPPQVFNEDSFVGPAGDGGANEDDDMVQINNSTRILSSKDHPPISWQP